MKICVQHARFVIIQSAWDHKLVIIQPLFSLIYNRGWRRQSLWLVLPSVGWMGSSLKICIYMIRLSSLLDLDIYFPLKAMFDYTLIKNRKTTELAGTNLSCPVVSLGFCVMKWEGQKIRSHQQGDAEGRPCKNHIHSLNTASVIVREKGNHKG